VFLDVGANAGAYTLFVANRVGRSGRIIAVEPHPTALARLHCNLALNGIDWAKVVPAALSDHNGTVSLFINERNIGSSSMLSGRRPDLVTRAIEVGCRSLSSLVAEEGLTRIDAIKLDVEGAEAPRPLLPRFMIIEDNRSVWKEDLLGLLERTGYVTQAAPNANLVLRLQHEQSARQALHG
jgi:FkbM family methyltransferase